MTVSVEDFANYVGEEFATSERQADLMNSLSVASAEVGRFVEKAFRPVPEATLDQCIKDYALAIYQRSSNNSGQYDVEAPAGPLDPMTRIKPLLAAYVMGV